MNHRHTVVPIGTIFGSLAALYLALGLAAFLSRQGPGEAPGVGAAAVFLVAVLTLARYLVIAGFARSLSSRRPAATLLASGAWIVALLALAVALVLIAKKAHDALAWAAVAACAGPASVAFIAALLGARALLRSRLGPKGALS
jgi:hypothetical protein